MAITPWMFALERTNYSRWLPVHIRDMAELPNKHPHVYKEFSKGGKFTVQKATNTFSSITLDQAHKQKNELIKGDVEIIGIAENPSVLLRWMVSRSELARMVKEFETTIAEDNTNQTCTTHHKQFSACQARFISHVQSLVSIIEELDNSFEEESTDLISLVSKDIADPAMKARKVLNDARRYLFIKNGRGLEGLPPTLDALEQHVKRAVYQGGYVREQATALKPVLPEPTNWGWTSGREKQLQRAGPLWL